MQLQLTLDYKDPLAQYTEATSILVLGLVLVEHEFDRFAFPVFHFS
jgi:hypothetical protein